MKTSRTPRSRLVRAPRPAVWCGVMTAVCLFSAAVLAAPASIEGDYQCDACHGYLRILRQRSGTYKVWLGVGGGSCGAEVLATGSVRYSAGVLNIPHALNGRRCTATIEFSEAGATVGDSCFTPEDEHSSTCALLGSYSKQAK
jgi:hypothetical protein